MAVRWFGAMLAVCVFGAAACGADEKPLFDEGSFTGINEAAIEYDCMETLQCKAQTETLSEGNTVASCKEGSAKVLQTDEAKQMSFLRKFGRCMAFSVCSYFNCTQENPNASYADMQRPKLEHTCQAEIDCRVTMGTFTGERASALQGCIQLWSGMLDNLAPDSRLRFETAHTQCMALTGCQYASCFNNGVGTAMGM
jgi:hypothetical protein